MSEPILKVNHISKHFGQVKALNDVSLEVYPGQIVGLLGPNGAGKSTLLKCIATLLRPHQGSISIEGYDVFKQHAQAMLKVGMSLDISQLYDSLTGQEHLQLIQKVYPNADIAWAINYLQLGNALKKQVRTYSMGMRQRLCLALAMMTHPHLLILDEPTNGLDPQAVFQLREALIDLVQHQTGILFSSHALSEVEKVADSLLFMNKGQLIQPESFSSMPHIKVKVQNPENISTQWQTRQDEQGWISLGQSFSDELRELLAVTNIQEIQSEQPDLEQQYRGLYE